MLYNLILCDIRLIILAGLSLNANNTAIRELSETPAIIII